MNRLWILCLLSVAAAPIYSPKYAEHVKSLQKVRTTTRTLIMPKVVVPPPNTNRYYLTLLWTNSPSCAQAWQILYGTNVLWTTNQILVPATNTNWRVNISNLVFGMTYWFQCSTGTCSGTQFVGFPPVQLILTNTVTIGCTGQLQMTDNLRGPWVSVTNKVFKLTQDRNTYWRSLARETLTFTMTNNQANYAQFMHKQ